MGETTTIADPIRPLGSCRERRNVLIVEQDAPVREGLAHALAGEDFVVLTAANGSEAIQHQAQQGQIDALLLDLDVPDQFRWQAVHRCTTANPDVSVIGMTAHAAHSALAEVADLDGVCQKPYEIGAVLRLLEGRRCCCVAN